MSKFINYIQSRLKTFVYVFKGLRFLVTEANAKIHLMVGTLVVLLGFLLRLSKWEWIALVGAIAMVLMAEAFNTAIEVLVDLVSPEFNEMAGRTKDLAAAATFICALAASCIGLIIFVPKLVGFVVCHDS